jgi:hypothetical protein
VEITYVEQLLLNMLCGLQPNELTDEDVAVLRERFGDDWMVKLGFEKEAVRR